MTTLSRSSTRTFGWRKRAHASIAILSMGIVMFVGCGGSDLTPASTDRYAEYQCPAPMGIIVREDCSHATLKFDGVSVGGEVSAGPVGVAGHYRDTVLREADTVVVVLKDQRESLCNNYNTCKLTKEDYIREQNRIDTAFAALLSIKTNVANMDSASATMVMQQIRDIRSGKMDQVSSGETAAAKAEPRSAPTAEADSEGWGPGHYMMQAVAGVAEKAGKVATNSEWGFDIDGSAIMGAYLDKGALLSFVTPLKGGKEYALIGQGSENVLDIDMRVRTHPEEEVVGVDAEKDATPVVQFTAPRDGNYEVSIQLADTTGPGAFVAIASMQKGGYNVPEKDIIASLSRAVMASTLANRRQGPLSFHESGNWSLYATVLKPNEASAYGGILLERGSTVFLATADDHAQNVDLIVQNGTTNAESSDTDPDANPVVVVPSNNASQRHVVRLLNKASDGPSFVTLVLLDK